MPKVNPAILAWAREKAGLTAEDAARAIGLSGDKASERLEEMETGARDPTRRQLLNMSDKYRRPLLTFYLDEPPEAASPTHDFRTLPDPEPGSEVLVDALVRNVRARQDLVRSALEDADEIEPLPFVGAMQHNVGSDDLAGAIRDIFGFDRAAFRQANSYGDAFRVLREAVEAKGIFVLLMGNLGHYTSNIRPSVFRGMALADEVAPFVVINETDARSAWSFTLLHEVCHILMGESAISGYDSEEAIERLCDDAAARTLLDIEELQGLPIADQLDEAVQQINEFANQRKVSRKMVAYNLLRAGIIDTFRYRAFADRFDEDRLEFQQKAAGGQGGPDYYVVRRHRIGQGLLGVVNRMVAEGALSATKAGKVLGVKPTAVGRMVEKAA
jgi:Zn-dependent peptidase ImmA (M78 family)